MAIALVAYGTKYGSTREVAEAIGTVLQEHGLDTAVRAAREVSDVDGYSAVVVGGPLYYFRWNRDARHFLSRNRKPLSEMPVAVFAVGPMNDTAEEFDGARKQLDKALGKFSWLAPRSVAVFGGKLDPASTAVPRQQPGDEEHGRKRHPGLGRDPDVGRVITGRL